MILTISGLPKHFSYQDAKAMIKQESHITNFILDDMSVDSNGRKKVTVGLADAAEGPVLISRLNGFMILAHRLTVTPLGGSQVGKSDGVHMYGAGAGTESRSSYGGVQTISPHYTGGTAASQPTQYGSARTFSSQKPLSYPSQPFVDDKRSTAAYPAGSILKAPTARDFIDKPARSPVRGYSPRRRSPPCPSPPRRSSPRRSPTRRSPPRRSPPRRSSPRRSPPSAPVYADSDRDKYGVRNSGPPRARPPFQAQQAPSSGNYPGASYPIGGESASSGSSRWKPVSPTEPFGGQGYSNRAPASANTRERSPYRSGEIEGRDGRRRRSRSPVGGWRGSGYSPPRRSPPRSADSRSPAHNVPPWEANRAGTDKAQSSRWDTKAASRAQDHPVPPAQPHSAPRGTLHTSGEPSWVDNLPPKDYIPPRFAPLSPVDDRRPPQNDVRLFAPELALHQTADPYFQSRSGVAGPYPSGSQGVELRSYPPQVEMGNFIQRDPQWVMPVQHVMQDFGPRGFAPQVGPRGFVIHEAPRVLPIIDGPRDFPPRDVDPRGGPYGYREDLGPRNLGPYDGPIGFDGRPRDFRGYDMEPRPMEISPPGVVMPVVPSGYDHHGAMTGEFGPRDVEPHFRQDGPPQDFGPRDFGREVGPDGDRGRGRELSREKYPKNRADHSSFERREPNVNPSERNRSKSEEQAKEMELRDLVAGRLAGQMLKKYKPRIEEGTPLHSDVEQELCKVLLERIDSIFGAKCGHQFGQIASAYRVHHEVMSDWDTIKKLVAKCSSKNYVRKRPAEGTAGPPTKKREVDPRPAPAVEAPQQGGSGVYVVPTASLRDPVRAVLGPPSANVNQHSRRLEFIGEQTYELPLPQRQALDMEIKKIKELIENIVPTPRAGNKAEAAVVNSIKGDGSDSFLQLLDLQVCKRILNIKTTLQVLLRCSPLMPNRIELAMMLKQYGCTNVKKSSKMTMTFVAHLNSYEGYDRLCSKGVLQLGPCILKIEPFQVTGPKNIKKLEKKATWQMETLKEIRKAASDTYIAKSNQAQPSPFNKPTHPQPYQVNQNPVTAPVRPNQGSVTAPIGPQPSNQANSGKSEPAVPGEVIILDEAADLDNYDNIAMEDLEDY